MMPRLPKIARPFWKRSSEWRRRFAECYRRIAYRLQKGLPPSPNCTGEEMAFHNIMDEGVEDADDAIGDELEGLPTFPNDDAYDMVKEIAVEDEDVLMLFEEGDNGSDDDEPVNVDNPVLGCGSTAAFMLGPGGAQMGAANLHPEAWFIAFKRERFNDHR